MAVSSAAVLLAILLAGDTLAAASPSSLHPGVALGETADSKSITADCFPAGSQLKVLDAARGAAIDRGIEDIVLGVTVMAVNGDGALAWSPVVSLPTSRPHVPPAEAPTYIRLTTAAGKVLTLSLNHIVYILPAPAAALTAGTSPISIAIELPFSSRQEIAAGEIRAGDRLFVQTAGYSVVPSPVVSTELLRMPSAFDVITEQGTIIINGVAVKCYKAEAEMQQPAPQ